MIDYSTMEAGPEMDRLIAEKVMGWDVQYLRKVYGSENNFSPSYNLINVWEVVDKIPRFILMRWETRWVCGSIGCDDEIVCYDSTFIDDRIWHSATAETVPLAICRAALLAADS